MAELNHLKSFGLEGVEKMLKIEKVSKTFNKETANEFQLFNDLKFTIEKGDFITVVGSNGAGKSSMLNLISGSIPIDKGKILLNEIDITEFPEHKRAKFIGRVFQDPSKGTSPSMNILENLSLAYNKGKAFGLTLGVNKKNIEFFKEQLNMLNLGLEDKIYTKVGLLSGGQRQALSLLMATMITPEILLLDEHTAALDPTTSENIMYLTNKIVKEKHITALMITHNLNQAIQFGNRLIMMHEGNIVLDLKAKDKKSMTKADLIEHFNNICNKGELGDRVMFA